MSGIPGRHADQFNLRLPDGMRDRLKAEAEANNRSLNAEIVSRLETTLSFSGNLAGPDAKDRVAMMIRATAAGATLDAIAAAQRAYEDSGGQLTAADLWGRIADKLSELVDLRMGDLQTLRDAEKAKPKLDTQSPLVG